jgi:hypothetical protein
MNRPALIIAHPGHELVILGWVEANRPLVTVLTDGSGRGGVSRLPSTLKLLREAGAGDGDFVEGMTDQQFYAAMLEGNVALFVDLAVRLGDELAERCPPYVAGDAREGFNPTHDVGEMIVAAAIARARRSGAIMDHYTFRLFAPHLPSDQGICHTLDDEQLRRKIAAAHAYPELAPEVEWALRGSSPRSLERYPDMAAIFNAAIAGMNERSFAIECLSPAGIDAKPGDRPFYELYGERLVADGRYERAIRYREHVAPIERALAAL